MSRSALSRVGGAEMDRVKMDWAEVVLVEWVDVAGATSVQFEHGKWL